MQSENLTGSSLQQPSATSLLSPSPGISVGSDPQMNCDRCKYNDQDVDTFPCATCHTRNA